jgi:phytoene dehydrogenase-like protein
MMIHLALSGLPDWTAGEELKRFAYVHLAPSFDVMAATYTQAMSGLLPDEPVLVVCQPTAIDPSRAPPGRHVFWVQVRVLPGTIRGDAAGAMDPLPNFRKRQWHDELNFGMSLDRTAYAC